MLRYLTNSFHHATFYPIEIVIKKHRNELNMILHAAFGAITLQSHWLIE